MDVNETCDALDKALELELEGYEFYMKCAGSTKNREGQEMFKHLAGEEEVHYKKVEELYRKDFSGKYCKNAGKKASKKPKASGVFEKNVPGGSLDNKSDALSALNISIKAEENSIRLYAKLANAPLKPETKRFFEKLVEEEKKHRSILEAEVEFVTETGTFSDFKIVTT